MPIRPSPVSWLHGFPENNEVYPLSPADLSLGSLSDPELPLTHEDALARILSLPPQPALSISPTDLDRRAFPRLLEKAFIFHENLIWLSVWRLGGRPWCCAGNRARRPQEGG